MMKHHFQQVKTKVIGLFKDELGGKIIAEFVAFRAKPYEYLMGNGSENKKAKGTKKCVIKHGLMFENYKDSLFNDQIILKSQQRFKSDRHELYTEEINKIAPSSNNDKRLQTFDKITSYPYGSNAFKVCKSEMMIVRGFFIRNYADCSFYDEIMLQQRK